MKIPVIDTLQMIRQIRDDHAQQLEHKNEQEIVDFYEEQAKQTLDQLRQYKSVQPAPQETFE